MEAFLEKVTLYDFIGYTIPGCVFWGLLGSRIASEPFFDLLERYKDYALYIFLLFLILSYITGIVLSEISRTLLWLVSLFGKRDNEPPALDTETIKKVLEKSGLVDVNAQGMPSKDKYMKVMYSDIQTDPAYKRIHNYASAEVMYKNMAAALITGCVVLLIFGIETLPSPFLLCCFLTGGIFLLRWYRFEKKKREYTVMWFSEKYLKGQE